MRGLRVIIAGAGLSAALPGVAAAHTDLPVIGVPLSSRLSAPAGSTRSSRSCRCRRASRWRASASTTPATPAIWPRASWAPERRVAVERPPRLDLTRPRAYGELLVDVAADLRGARRRPADARDRARRARSRCSSTASGAACWPTASTRSRRSRRRSTSALLSACIDPAARSPAPSALLVQGLGRGDAPRDAGGALRAASSVFPRVLGAQLLYAVAVLAGLVLFIVPGIYARRPLLLRHAGRRAGRPRRRRRRCAAAARSCRARGGARSAACSMTALLVGRHAPRSPRRSSARTGSGALYVAGGSCSQAIARGRQRRVRDPPLLRPPRAARAAGARRRLRQWPP